MKIRIKSLDDIRDNENITIEHDGESISLQLEVIEWLVGYYGSDIEIDGEEYDLSPELLENLREYLEEGTSRAELDEKLRVELAKGLKERIVLPI